MGTVFIKIAKMSSLTPYRKEGLLEEGFITENEKNQDQEAQEGEMEGTDRHPAANRWTDQGSGDRTGKDQEGDGYMDMAHTELGPDGAQAGDKNEKKGRPDGHPKGDFEAVGHERNGDKSPPDSQQSGEGPHAQPGGDA